MVGMIPRRGVVFLSLVGQKENHDEKIFYCGESHEFSSLRKEVRNG
jgi:hypothetical protein